MELDSRKKRRRDRMMRSNSLDMKEVREIGRKEAGESRGFPILCMGIIEDVFQMEEKECKDQERLKMRRRIQRERKESKTTSETPQGTWLGGAQ